MDIFEAKGIKPMLISEQLEPYDDPDSIFELKLDGIRCIAYCDDSTDLRNKRDMKLLPRFPELKDIHNNCKVKCILDGELIVVCNGVPDFYELQKRTLLSDLFKIQLSSSKLPASFVAYDILYHRDKEVTGLALLERKRLLAEVVDESERISVSRYVETNGIMLFELAKEQQLEGIVGKKKDSLYWFDKRTKDWIKCKLMSTDDCVVCGYIVKDNNMISLVLGQYNDEGKLVYRGHVTMGVSLRLLNQQNYKVIDYSPFGYIPKGNEEAIWLEPNLVCIVESMKNDKESFRQPVLKGFRDDKAPRECTIQLISTVQYR
jgi:bifunctional non-homologous end joining protein LigD